MDVPSKGGPGGDSKHCPPPEQEGNVPEGQGGTKEERKRRTRAEAAKELNRLKNIREAQKKIAELKALLRWRKTNFAIKYYSIKKDENGEWQTGRPHEKQDAFHRDRSLIRVASGGNRSGKSTAGINEDVSHALGFRPWLEEEDPDRKVNVAVPNKGLICGESFGEQVAKVLVPKLLGDPERGIPGAVPTEHLAGVKRNPAGVVTQVHLKNGSSIYLQSYDQDVDLFESADYDWFHADEPPPRPIWVAVQRGLADRRGRTWLTMTPLKEPWIYDEIYARKDVGLHYFDIEDNLGFGLTREGIDQFASSLTEDEREARLRGRYFHLSGLVYKDYGPKLRLKRFPIPRHWGVWFHVDTHPRTPHHAVWIAVAPNRKKYICGELKNGDRANRVLPFIEAIKVYEREKLKRRPDEVVRLIEPGAQAPDPLRDGHSIWDEFAENGLRCRPGSKNRDAGILLLQKELQSDATYGIEPNIFVFEDLEGVDFEFRHYVWDDWNKRAATGKTEKQAPKDQNDHFLEGIHRILLDEPFCDPEGSTEETEERASAQAGSINRVTGY